MKQVTIKSSFGNEYTFTKPDGIVATIICSNELLFQDIINLIVHCYDYNVDIRRNGFNDLLAQVTERPKNLEEKQLTPTSD